MEENKKKKNHTVRKIIAIAAAVLVCGLLAVGIYGYVHLKTAKENAKSLKSELGIVVDSIKGKDKQGVLRAKSTITKIDKLIDELQEELDNPIWNLPRKIGKINDEFENAVELLDIADDAVTNLLKPAIAVLEEYPLSGLKVGDGFNVAAINRYLALFEELQPELEKTIERISGLKFNYLDKEGKIAEYQVKLEELMKVYYEALEYLPLIKTVLGDGSNRLYLLVAQNSAEARATGGFPGSIGTLSITDGILQIGDFVSVYNALVDYVAQDIYVTQEEITVFGSWIYAPRDACFISDFPRAAQIWARAFEDCQANAGYSCYVDGVFSLTPAIIQKVLAITGEITISDGTVLNGENATKVLQHDLYHYYFDNNHNAYMSNYFVDDLFAETAKTAMHSFTESCDLDSFKKFYEAFKEGVEERIVMMWMKNSEEQELIRSINASGELNYDPSKPVTGIYFSMSEPNKLGWYLDITPAIGEPWDNGNGTITYPVEVHYYNCFNPADFYSYHQYVVGAYGGGMSCYLNIFAPAGGYISNVYSNYLVPFNYGTYNGLQAVYITNNGFLPAQLDVMVHYEVTVSAGTEPLKAVTTPTLTKYR